MSYSSLEACLIDLEKQGELVRIKEEIDPCLEMAAIHIRIHESGGPALLFENVKGSRYRTASNIFGTLERSKFIFRDTLRHVEALIEIKNNPALAFKKPFRNLPALMAGLSSFPKKNPWTKPVMYSEISIAELPLIQHWPMDGGAFVTLPQVYTEDPDKPGIMNANLGMYRIQLSGNNYELNKEVGLHYQLHRGIGVHQTKYQRIGKPMKVSVFVGGPPAHTVAAVMPLPEGMSEMTFAGVLGKRRFRYTYQDGFAISTDADFVITGEVFPGDLKPEGPFGDHLGYYSLQHEFPVMKIHKVYARKNAIWPFTVVGRPPQEDTSFGQLIHSMTGNAIQHEIPGLKQIHAVDASGVHPLLLAVGSERYTPYQPAAKPSEILTIANHILGTGQLSLAKFLFITAEDRRPIDSHDIESYFTHVMERIHTDRDIHFHTQTTIDTLDYSGTGLNSGSKVVFAAYGNPVRKLSHAIPESLNQLEGFGNAKLVMPGIIALDGISFKNYETSKQEMDFISRQLAIHSAQQKNDTTLNEEIVFVIICDDAGFVSETLNNFLWTTFTRCNPSHDIHGVNAFHENKHWGCRGPVIIDARIKPHHAPALEKNSDIEKKIDRLFEKGGSLYNVIK